MLEFDTVLHPDWVIPIAPRRQVLTAHSLGLKAGQIAAIAPREEARLFTANEHITCLLYTSPSPRDGLLSRMPSSA